MELVKYINTVRGVMACKQKGEMMKYAKRKYFQYDVTFSTISDSVKTFRILATSPRHARLVCAEEADDDFKEILKVKQVAFEVKKDDLFKLLQLHTKAHGNDPDRLYIYQMIGELSPYINTTN